MSESAYDAFISYEHEQDKELATALQRRIERFAKPWYRQRALRVFRDETNLTASPGLWPSIEQQLAQSRWFVLFACPKSADSHWVDKEVQWWLDNGSEQRLLIVLTGGELVWDHGTGEVDRTRTTALPPSLLNALRAEPHSLDVRELEQQDQIDPASSAFQRCVEDLAAAIREVPKDSLVGEHIRQHRRTMLLTRSGVSVLAVLLVISIVATAIAAIARDNAVSQAQLSKSRELAVRSARVMGADPALAKRMSLAAWRIAPTPEAWSAMQDAALRPDMGIVALTGARMAPITFSPDGRFLAGMDPESGKLRIWDLVAGHPAGEPLNARAGAVVFSPDSSTFVTADPGDFRLWDTKTRKPLGGISDPSAMGQPAFSPDGRTLAVPTWDPGESKPVVRLWDAHTRNEVRPPLTGRNTMIASVTFAADGRVVAAVGLDHEVRRWDVATGRPLPGPAVPGERGIMTTSANAELAAFSDADGNVRVWDINSGREPGPPFATGPITALALSPDVLATAGADNAVRLWDPVTGAQLAAPLTGHTKPVAGIFFSPDGRTMATASEDGTVRLWNISTRQRRGGPIPAATAEITAITFGRNGSLLVGADNGMIHSWDLQTHQEIGRPLENLADVADLVHNPDGNTLTAGGFNGSVRVWDADTGHLRSTPVPDEDRSSTDHLVLSGDGRMMLNTNHLDAQLWDAPTGRPLGAPLAETVNNVAISADGRIAATIADHEAQLWDVRSRRPLGKPLPSPDRFAALRSLELTDDGRTLAVGDGTGNVELWDVATGEPVSRPAYYGGHDDGVDLLAFSPDGRTLAISNSYGDPSNIRLVDVRSGRDLGAPISAQDTVTGIAFTPDGRSLVTGGKHGTVRVWNVDDTADVITHLCADIRRGFTAEEWQTHVKDQPFQPTCQ